MQVISIIHVVWSAQFGGIQKVVYDISIQQSQNKGLKTSIMFAKDGGEYLSVFRDSGIQTITVGLKSGVYIPFSKILKIYRLFKNISIIHFHDFNPYIALIAVLSKKKIVYTEHGNFYSSRPKKKFDFLLKFLLKYFLNHRVHFITFNSNFTFDQANFVYKISNPNKKIVYNGLKFLDNYDVNISDALLMKQLKGRFVIGTSSRLAHFKRVNLLIKAFSSFRYKGDSVLLIVGDGPLFNELKEMVNELDIKNQVIFTGYQKDVSTFQNLMDICIFPSVNEPFGLVAIEVLALGKPVLVFKDGGGFVEIIEPLEPLDIAKNMDEMINRMEYYYENRHIISVEKNKRKTYVRKFDIELMERECYNIYQRLVN